MFNNKLLVNEIIFDFNKTALCIAVENRNIDIVKLLLENPNINPNIASIYKIYYFIQFQNKIFNKILPHVLT